MVDQFPTLREMVRVESLSDDQLIAKTTDSRLKGYEERVAGLIRQELQVSALKRQVFGLNDKLSSSYASFAKSKAKGKKKIKSLTKSLDNLHAETTPSELASFFRVQFQGLVRKFLTFDEFSRVQGELLSLAASAGFERELSMHQTKDEFDVVLKKMAHFISKYAGEPLFVILQLEPEKLARSANVPASKDAHVSYPIVKESTVTPAFESLELPANVVPTSSAIISEQNKEWVNAMVDGPNPGMTDGTTHAKSGSAFVRGTSYVLYEVAEVNLVGSERVSSGLGDVVVALSIGEKADGLLLSSAADEETTANPSGV
ncbi:hypothetical protein Tco_0133252 [Tanacetum coccineum]